MEQRHILVPHRIQQLLLHFEKKYGCEMYLVGGFVRDSLLGNPPSDVDVACRAKPQIIKQILNADKDELGVQAIYTVGEKYGTIGVKLEDFDVEFTTYRSDTYEPGNRKPEVQFGRDIIKDLSRRDFTINAIAAKSNGEILDPFGGVRDLQDGFLKAVAHDAVGRMLEDPLRMLRAVRFSVRFNMSPDVDLRWAIKQQNPHILNISWERIRDEFSKILLSNDPVRGMRMLDDLGLLRQILPEIHRLIRVEQISPWHEDNVFEHTLKVLAVLPRDLELRLAGLFHDAGKHSTMQMIDDEQYGPRTIFHGHEKYSEKLAYRALRRLHYPNSTTDKVAALCANHMRPLTIYNSLGDRSPSTRQVRRFMAKCNDRGATVDEQMILNHADMQAHKDPVMDDWYVLQDLILRVRTSEQVQPEKAQSPLNGQEIMDLVWDSKPGPWVGRVKEHLTNLVLDGIMEVDDKETAKREARKFLWV